ncbi:nuclear transport factor 2 family protein [Sphingobium sp. Sx8-8]|uniref:nuclear transport factor 2 family protein n=1 Tax=Sphingobium sp. Sx8-8 TaxID=2933617 RepID=UPI001F5AC796|nr:nuclear transport factor 2 family protein [Sphingobium sp. Sx8-8]
MDALEELLAIEHIKRLKARYFRFVDTQDWTGFRRLFTDDAVLEFRETMDEPCSIDAFMDGVRNYLAGVCSVHHGHMPEITIRSSTEASAIWAMDDKLFFSKRTDGPDGIAMVKGYGHYHETYVRQGNEWRISSLRLTRLRLERTLNPRMIA